MKSIVVYAGAALAEIAGCFAFWAWLLTLVEVDAAGRAYAA